MRLFVVFLVALALPLRAADDLYPELSNEPAVLELFARVFMDGGAGFRETESSAFLLLHPDGHYSLVPWPATRRSREHAFRGAVPHFTLAIVHTHPASSPRPSAADEETARKLRLPVVVLTPRHVVYVTPGGETVAAIENRAWAPDKATQ